MDPAATQLDEDILRVKRRQKILQNRESRLKKLLGENSDAQVKDIIKDDDARFQSLLSKDNDDIDGPPIAPIDDGPLFNVNVSAGGDCHPLLTTETCLLSSQSQDRGRPCPTTFTVTSTASSTSASKDLQTPLVSITTHKSILILLGISVPFFTNKYLLLYFMTWELVYFTMLNPPTTSLSQKSWTLGVLFNLICLACKLNIGLKYRLERTLVILSQVISDISLFIICSLCTIFFI